VSRLEAGGSVWSLNFHTAGRTQYIVNFPNYTKQKKEHWGKTADKQI